jgi:hypothetical protein
MLRRPFLLPLLLILATAALSGVLYAQLESGDRGILPFDSSGTLEITGIHVDVGGKDANDARYTGWRIAQRQGFRALWAKAHGVPIEQAPNLPDSTLDGIVSSIIVEREQIGPNRYIADLGIQFDRARAGEMLGVGGEHRRSAPMLLIPVIVTGGTATSVELKNAWQRAWAQVRTSQSAIDYVRVSGLAVDPLLVNASETERPGRGWWRNITDLYGAADILVAEVQLQRLYPGGPARARFIARHGPDNEIIGGFTLTAANSEGIPAMMTEGVRRMDELFTLALSTGNLERDPTLDIPEPPPPPEVIGPPQPSSSTGTQNHASVIQVQIASPNINNYNFAIAHLRLTAGVDQANPQSIAIGGISSVIVTYRGDIAALAAALQARGWSVDFSGNLLRMAGNATAPPPLPAPLPPPPPPPPQQPSPQPSNQQ